MLLARITLCLLALLFASGCASTRLSERDYELLSRHPVNETRMAASPQEGFSPTGIWRIKGEKNYVYLGGTVHVLTTNQFPFPSSFYAAYQDSKELYIEVSDRSSLFENAGMTFKALGWLIKNRDELLLPKGQTIAGQLKPELAKRVKDFYGRDYSKVARYTPEFLVWTAQMEGLGEQAYNVGGVEDAFSSMARRDRKKIRTLDDSSVRDLAFTTFDHMLADVRKDIAEKGVDKVIEETLFGAEEDIDLGGWHDGDYAKITAEMDNLRKEAPELWQQLLPDRNNAWLPKIETALHKKHNSLVLVGAAHLPGQDGLLQLLRNKGYTVEQMHGLPKAKLPE